jgi:saccharopepsin
VFPLHPLDVAIKNPNVDNVCLGTFIPQDTSAIGSGVLYAHPSRPLTTINALCFISRDWILGDSFLRGVYSVYDFGDFDQNHNMGDPYVKLVSLIDPNAASAEFAQERNTTARNNITFNAASGSGSGSTTVSLSNDISTTLDKINSYLPALLAVMAFNALAVLVLLIGAGIWLCRRRAGNRRESAGPRARRNKGRVTPLPLEPMGGPSGMDAEASSYVEPNFPYADNGASQSKHVYQPVSMALTEDTFVPPSPAFSRYGDGGFKGVPMADRPKSVA